MLWSAEIFLIFKIVNDTKLFQIRKKIIKKKNFFKWEMILLAVIWKSLEIGSDFF